MTPLRRTSAVRWRCRQVAIVLGLLLVASVGCSDHKVEEAEHHHPAHKPADYLAAVERLREVHEEILSGPLVVREIHAKHDDHDHHSHGHAHQHVSLDAIQELGDIVGWLPDLAADSDMEETPWNRVYDASNRLNVILVEALSHSSDERREAYVQHKKELARHLQDLIDIRERLLNHEQSLADDL